MSASRARVVRVAVIGDLMADFPPHAAIATALEHSAAKSSGLRVEVEWHGTASLDPAMVATADAVWCAPGSPFADLEGALAGIRAAREHRLPFLGTCAGFQHGILEIARNVLGVVDAQHREYGAAAANGQPLFIDELLCSLAGQTMTVQVVDPVLRDLYGASETSERYYCRFGLNEQHRGVLAQAGLIVAGIDPTDLGTRIMRLRDHPFFVLTLFVPQTSSTPQLPHPIIHGFVDAAARSSACA